MTTITDPEIMNMEIPGQVPGESRVMRLNQLRSGDIEVQIEERVFNPYRTGGTSGHTLREQFKFTIPANRKQVLADYFARA